MGEQDAGLYEQPVTEPLRARLDEIAERLVDRWGLNEGETAGRNAWHVSRQIDLAHRGAGSSQRGPVASTLLDRRARILDAPRNVPSIPQQRYQPPCEASTATPRFSRCAPSRRSRSSTP